MPAAKARQAYGKRAKRHCGAGKRETPTGALLPDGRKALERANAITTQGEVRSSNDWQEATILLDTGAEVNIISQRYAVEQQFKSIRSELPTYSWINQTKAYSHEAYEVPIRMTDAWGKTQEHQMVFYGMLDAEPVLIIGVPGLRKTRILIDCEKRAWRWKLDGSSLLLEPPEEFAKTLQAEAHVFAVITSNVAPPATSSQDDGGLPPLPSQLDEYRDVFSSEAAGTLPRHAWGDHAIDIEHGKEAPYGPLYNLSPKELAVLREYLDDAMAKGWIRRSTSPAGAPILFVPKKDGKLRLCVDYRGLNKVTIKNRLALPLISETLDRLAGAKLFTKLDLKDAYHRIRIKKGDEWKTAFRTRYGHYEYLVMPFGLTNAPATFQGYINRALSGIVDIFCVVYLDDILIFSNSPEEHWRHVREVLERLRQYQLYANLGKCEFGVTQVEFLGYLISTKGVLMDPRRVEAIAAWETPKSFRDVQVFLGFANFYRRFIHRYSVIAKPITDLLKGAKEGRKGGLFEWPEEAERAMRKLCAAFTTAPLLRYYSPDLSTRLETDASKNGLAAIISQLFEDAQWHPIAFWSRKLTPAERNYETHDQELLAIVAAVKHWRHYIDGLGNQLEILTDHNNLRGFMKVKALNGRQARWAIELAAYDLVIKHRPGKSNPADAPSRRPLGAGKAQGEDTMLPSLQRTLGMPNHPVRVNVLYGEVNGQPSAEAPLSRELASDPYTRHPLGVGLSFDWEAGTIAPTQRVFRTQARLASVEEAPYKKSSSTMLELVKQLQLEDNFVIEKRNRIATLSQRQQGAKRAPVWTLDRDQLLRNRGKIYVPQEPSVQRELIRRHHDDALAGHFGEDKTAELISRKYHWTNLKQDVHEYISSCDICQRVRAPRHRPYGEMQALPQPEQPWQEITMDFITGLPPSRRGTSVYDAIWVIVDRYTKMARYIPTTRKLKAAEMADAFIEHIVRHYGIPKGIVSDRGTIFTSEFWSEFCYTARIKRRLSTAFHPQTDGQTERQNQTLEHYLRVYYNKK